MSEKLAVVEKQNHNLVAAVSHELRSPLARIRVTAEAMELAPVETDVQSQSRAICIEVDQMDCMVSDLLQSARMHIGPNRLNDSVIDLCELLPDIVQRYRVTSGSARAPLKFETQLSTLEMTIDAELLTQAITNLIDNAKTATQNGAEIIVRLTKTDRHGIIEIIDWGVGIDNDQQKVIFDQFYRIDPSRSRNTGGVGLGLTIVKQIVFAHGGAIELYSQPGKGSTFRVLLPLPAESQS